MKTLFVAWQDTAVTRAWYPIGRLDADIAKPKFEFRYTHGAETAERVAGLKALDAFPDLHKIYKSPDLFPLFKNRIMAAGREDFKDYVQQLGLDPAKANPLDILALTGGERQTDNLEVFPMIKRDKNGDFACRFFLHGWRHVNEAAQERLMSLHEGEALRVAIELNNPVTNVAVQLQTSEDYHMIGWAPRYLVGDLFHAICDAPNAIHARIVKINPTPAPAKQRVLIEIKGRLATDYQPMSSYEFQPLLASV